MRQRKTNIVWLYLYEESKKEKAQFKEKTTDQWLPKVGAGVGKNGWNDSKCSNFQL